MFCRLLDHLLHATAPGLMQNWGKELRHWLGDRVTPVVVDDTRADCVKKSFQVCSGMATLLGSQHTSHESIDAVLNVWSTADALVQTTPETDRAYLPGDHASTNWTSEFQHLSALF